MYCPQCGSSIDYRFSTTCLICNGELVIANGESQPLLNTDDARKTPSRLRFRHHVANLTTTLVAAAVGLLLGAVITYFGGWVVFSLFYSAGVIATVSCGTGNAIGVLLILVGANIGSTCGGIFGFAHRTYKPATS